MGIVDIDYYGFVLFYGKNKAGKNAGKYSGFIGSSFSTEEKMQGQVQFMPEDLAPGFEKELSHNIWQNVYLVKYRREPRSNRGENVEPVARLEKRQYPGVLQVDGVGRVSYQRKGETEFIPLGELGMESSAPTEQTASVEPEGLKLSFGFPFDMSGLDYNVSVNDKGIETVEFLLPYERIFDGERPEGVELGFVNYYVPALSTYVRRNFLSRLYHEDGEGDRDSCLFSNADGAPNTSRVGRINTGKSLYFITYRLSGQRVPNPVTPSELMDEAVDVVFFAKITQRRVVSLVQEEEGVRVVLALSAPPGTAAVTRTIKLSDEPSEGQTAESFLNRYVTGCLQEGNIKAGLDKVEQYRDELSEEKYHQIRFRLLPRLYKDTKTEESRLETIRTIEELLTLTNKTSFRLILLFEKGNKHLQGGEVEKAREAFQAWTNLYREYIATNPEAAEGLQSALALVKDRLHRCEGEESERFDEVEIEAETSDSRVDAELEDYILELMDRYNCAVLGSDFADCEDLSSLTPERAGELKAALQKVQTPKQVDQLCALARIYHNLPKAPVEVVDEDESIEQRNCCLRLALVRKAQQHVEYALRSNGVYRIANERSASFHCLMALSLYVKEGEIAAALGASFLKADQFRSALDGALSMRQVLEDGAQQGRMGTIAREMAILCQQNRAVRNRIESCLSEELSPDSPVMRELVGRLEELGGGESHFFLQALDEAVQAFDNFYRKFVMIEKEGRVEAVAKAHRDFLKEQKYNRWMDGEMMVRTDDLRSIFLPMDNFDKEKEFSTKADLIQKALGKIRRFNSDILQNPTVISYNLYLPRIEEYNAKLLYTYQNLCTTTKPRITLGTCDERVVDNGVLNIAVPVVNDAAEAQEARHVRLIVDENPDYVCLKPVIEIPGGMGSGVRRFATVSLQLANPDKKLVSVKLRVEYEYTSDVKIIDKTKKVGHKTKLKYEGRAQDARAFFPGPDEKGWMDLDVAVDDQRQKHTLSLERVKKFADDGQLDFSDAGILKIVRNRDGLINGAIEWLTVQTTGEDGQPRRALNSMGRWVLFYGQWRVGKTVILNCIEEKFRNEEDYPNAIVLKLQCAGRQPDFESYFARQIYRCLIEELMWGRDEYREVFERVRMHLRIPAEENPAISWETLGSFLKLFVEGIRRKVPGAAVVLLVDEFTDIYQAIISGYAAESFPARWTEFISKARVLCVTAGGEHTVSLMDTFSPNTLQKTVERKFVRYLSKENVDEYLRYVMGESPEDDISREDSYFSESADEALDRIYQLTRGNAYLLKNFCTWLIEYINEKKRLYLTRNVVDETLDYIMKKEGMDVESFETTYFNSLYNPFNESKGDSGLAEGAAAEAESAGAQPPRRRIEGDTVRDDNLKILHTIVDLADRTTHLCSYEELVGRLEILMGKTVFLQRYNTLLSRKIIEVDGNGNVSIVIDLYYEIVSRMRRDGKHGNS